MGQPKTDPSNLTPNAPSADRLDSWKDIANYLNRGVRTVQRWEKEEGLPVHRHLHDKLGTIYAYKTELDAWWQNGQGRLEAKEAVGTEEAKERSKRWVLAGAVAALAAIAVGAALWWPRAPALPFDERDWVLIASFENRTGEPVLDGTLEYALERELSNSRFVNVVPHERVNDALQLMKKPPATVITASIAREVALRDGGIRALVTGRVEKLDNTYLVSAALVNPANGATVRSFGQEADGEKNILPAIRRLSRGLRESLGEELSHIRLSEQKLEKVTTPSLRALQLFTQADELIRQGARGQASAEELLRQAVAEDPGFASAHIYLAWALRNLGRPREDYREPAKRAKALADLVSEREQYFIRGSYFHLMGENEQAITSYETLLRQFPDHYWANNNLVNLYERLGRAQEAVPHFKRWAELRPHDFHANCRTALHVGRLTGNLVDAKPYLERARGLATPESTKRYPVCAAWVDLFAATEFWLQGDIEKALAEANRVEGTLAAREGEERATWALFTGGVYQDLGRLRLAEQFYGSHPNGAIRHWNLAWIALDRGDQAAFQKHVQEMSRFSQQAWWLGAAIFYARAGLLAEAEDWIRKHGNTPGIEVAAGEVALAKGQRREAEALLRSGFASTRALHGGESADAVRSLAQALQGSNDGEGALQVLEDSTKRKVELTLMGGGSTWIRLEHQRARLLRKLGRQAEARQIEAELLKLLAYADDDHAISRELRAASKLRPEAAPR